MRIVPQFCLIVVAVLAAAGSSESADWTQFRGPTGQGHAEVTNLPATWSEDENIAWKVALPGFGWSSPVVADDRLYLTTAVAEEDSDEVGRSLRVLCLSAKNGEILWNKEAFRHTTGKVKIHRKNSHASPTPILEEGRIYVHFGPHGTACLKTDGSIVWATQELQYATPHGSGGSPAIADDLLVICCDGSDERFVVGLDKHTGKQVWRSERELEPKKGFSFCTPMVINTGGRSQAICPGSGGVWSYDPKTGRQLWRVAYGEGFSVVPRPIAAHGLVFVCSGFGDGQMFAIDPTGSGDVTESHVKWKRKKGVPKSPSLLAVNDAVYMVSDGGVASCVDAVSGKLHWQQRLDGAFSASPSLADGLIYFQNETGVTTIVRPGRKYEEVATNKLGDGKTRTFASFAFVDNAILLRSEAHLYRIQN